MTDTISLSSLDRSFADFIVRIESKHCEKLWIGAALASAVSCRGDVCLDLDAAQNYSVRDSGGGEELPVPPMDVWVRELSGCSAIGKPGDFTPLVLDESGRLYLHRSWDAEKKVAEDILARISLGQIPNGMENSLLERYFPEGCSDRHQREAARSAMVNRFTVITGGPGTGKTSTVARILLMQAEMNTHGPLRIVLAAPTGKAAARLKQSLDHSFDRMDLDSAVRERLPGEVVTVHRLLGAQPGRARFRRNKDNQVPCDLLVVDEASMVDLSLMARLLEALPAESRLILLGDRDQLSSVEAGAVLADLCSGIGASRHSSDSAAVIQLTKSYRFDENSGIGVLSRLVQRGDGAAAVELLNSGLYGDLVWRILPSPAEFHTEFRAAVQKGFAGFALAVSPEEALDALEQFRVLTPHREGAVGVVSLNRLAETVLALDSTGNGRPAYRPLMVSGNNYEMELFNGDIGVATGDKECGDIFFTSSVGGVRRVTAVRVPSHESAFAMTIHKSQGSEFDRVLIVLPDRMSPVLCREMLYTAITRARSGLEIWGTEAVLVEAIQRTSVRRSALAEHLGRQGRFV